MASVKRMTMLAQEIVERTKIVTEYLLSKGLEAASLDVDGLAEFPIPPEDEVPFKARLGLVAATKELYDISLGPKEGLRYLAWDFMNNLSLQAVWDFKVAEAVPLSGTISYEELTAKVEAANGNLPIGVLSLRCLLRHAMTNRIFCEPKKGQVAHTRASLLLLEDEPLKNWVGLMCNDLWLPVANAVNAMKRWPASQEPNETGVNIAYGQSLPFFNFVQRDQALAKRYSLAMEAHSGAAGYSLEHVIKGYAWGDLGDAVVVDMGGNQGYVSFAIAEAFPRLSFIVQDQAGVRTTETVAKVPDALAGRVRLTTHDFFTPQTEVADVYFFRLVFHGFADKYCVRILQALIPALKKGARIVINDGALPEPRTGGYIEERTMRTLDLLMHAVVHAREREADDWAALFKAADARYRFNRIWLPESSRMSFIEAEWTGE